MQASNYGKQLVGLFKELINNRKPVRTISYLNRTFQSSFMLMTTQPRFPASSASA